jgi:plasmid stabilization system protein ParE
MANGYKVIWTDFALVELENTIEYLERNWTEREIKRLVAKLEDTLKLISKNPELFQNSDSKNVRRAVVTKHNVLYYRQKSDALEIISFFSTVQNPNRKNF